VAREPDAAHDVDVEVALPVVVGDVGERLDLERADVVHQDVDVAQRLRDVASLPRVFEVGGDPGHDGPRNGTQQALHSGLEPDLVPSVDHDGCALAQEGLRDRVADPLRRTTHERPPAGQLQIHVVPSSRRRWQGTTSCITCSSK
jgi:hypothetical protein